MNLNLMGNYNDVNLYSQSKTFSRMLNVMDTYYSSLKGDVGMNIKK